MRESFTKLSLFAGVGTEELVHVVGVTKARSVIWLGRKLSSWNISVLTGHIPVVLNPKDILRGVTAISNDVFTIPGIS